LRLSELITACEQTATLAPNPYGVDPEIEGLTADSRAVKPGCLFAALPGAKTDGRAFIPGALANGAVAVLLPDTGAADPASLHDDRKPHVRFVLSSAPRRCFSLMAARFFSAQPPVMVAVTGTNGKTSICAFYRQMWQSQGRSSAAIGSLGVDSDAVTQPYRLTTPEPVALHTTLKQLADAGVEFAAMEASSHGIIQNRLDGVKLRAAGFTNVSRDHLDYHKDMDSYVQAKVRLFTELLDADGCAVLNADADYAAAFIDSCRARGLKVMTYGRKGEDLRILDIEPLRDGQILSLNILGRSVRLRLPLVGEFQAENALCALGLFVATGGDVEDGLKALETIKGAKGRVELVATTPSGGLVYIDYAHTPDAHVRLLPVLRRHTTGKLALVFGCGGDRDPGKRPEMGIIAQSMADRVYVTDDNPRSEDPATIRKAILVNCPKAREIADRGEAIRAAVADLESGDLLVVTGKGPDRGQIMGDQVLPFSDYEEILKAVREVGR